MAYKAAEKIDPLDYDFAPFVEAKGTTPEFETERIKTYWNGVTAMQRRHVEHLREWETKREQLGERPSQDALEAFYADYERWADEDADARLDKRRKLLAMLCDNQPDEETLTKLPGRVFDDFEAAMQEELTPKGLRNVTSSATS